jgi:hypothetical protein
VLSNTKQSHYFSSIYKRAEELFNKSQATLKAKGRIPFPRDYDTEIKKRIKDIRLFYNILKEIKKDENKISYLITLTSSSNLEEKLTKFIAKLNYLKTLKEFNGLQFDYISVIEPKKDGLPHMHIEIIVDKVKGIYTAIKDALLKLDYEYKNIVRFDKNISKNNYLMKMISENNYKPYVAWTKDIGISFTKAIRRSRYIRISKDIKITLKEYKKVLRRLMKTRTKGAFIGLQEVRDYFLLKPLDRIRKSIFRSTISVYKKTKSKKTLYRYINQVDNYCLNKKSIAQVQTLRNNSP